jgi:hypothetical protein
MEVDVVKAAMRSIANLVIPILSVLMMISEPFFESKWLRKHDLDYHTQFHPQYLIHVGFYVEHRQPPTPAPTKQSRSLPPSSYRIASQRCDVGPNERTDKSNKNNEKSSQRDVVGPNDLPDPLNKNTDQASRRVVAAVALIDPQQQHNDKASRPGVVAELPYPQHLRNQNNDKENRRGVVTELPHSQPHRNQNENNEASRRGVLGPNKLPDPQQASNPTELEHQNKNHEKLMEPEHQHKNYYEEASRRGDVSNSTEPEHQRKNYGKEKECVKEAETHAASALTRRLSEILSHC